MLEKSVLAKNASFSEALAGSFEICMGPHTTSQSSNPKAS